MTETTDKPVLLPDPAVARRYGIHPFTLRRWDENPDLGFPPVIVVNGRRYREVKELDKWDRKNSREAAQLRAGQRSSSSRSSSSRSSSSRSSSPRSPSSRSPSSRSSSSRSSPSGPPEEAA